MKAPLSCQIMLACDLFALSKSCIRVQRRMEGRPAGRLRGDQGSCGERLSSLSPVPGPWPGRGLCLHAVLGCGHGWGRGGPSRLEVGASSLGLPGLGRETLTQPRSHGAERLAVLPVGRGLGPASFAFIVHVNEDSATRKKRDGKSQRRFSKGSGLGFHHGGLLERSLFHPVFLSLTSLYLYPLGPRRAPGAGR